MPVEKAADGPTERRETPQSSKVGGLATLVNGGKDGYLRAADVDKPPRWWSSGAPLSRLRDHPRSKVAVYHEDEETP